MWKNQPGSPLIFFLCDLNPQLLATPRFRVTQLVVAAMAVSVAEKQKGVGFYLPPRLREHSPNPAFRLLPLKSSQMPPCREYHQVRSPDGRKRNATSSCCLIQRTNSESQILNSTFHFSTGYAIFNSFS